MSQNSNGFVRLAVVLACVLACGVGLVLLIGPKYRGTLSAEGRP